MFLMFFGVQDPNQGQGLSGLVAPGNSLFCCNRVQFSSKNHGFVATGYHFLRKTMVLLQQGTIFLEKPWFCCNRVPFSSKNNGFVATGYHFPRKTILYYSLGEGFKGGGFEVCGRQDLDFKFRKNKITK